VETRDQKLISLSPWAVSAGVVLLLLGLGWDAVLHSLDPDLAAREGVFSLSNPGHVLFGGGIAVIVAGALMFFAGKALTSSSPVRFALPAVALVALSITTFALAATTGTIGGPDHVHDDGTVHTHAEHEEFEAQQAGSAAPSTHPGASDDHHGEAIAISAAELEAAARLVAETKAAAARFEDIEVALADGYYEVAPPRNGLAHYINSRYTRDGRILDPERPESLVYLRLTDGSWKLVGVLYRMPSPDEPGPRIGGPLTTWHAHDNLCTENGRVVATTNNTGSCARGTSSKTPEMLHVWLVNNPNGVFSDDMEPAAIRQIVEGQASR
jgi:hypothetical protein